MGSLVIKNSTATNKFRQNLIIKDLNLSVASASDYKNVRCVSQSSYHHNIKGIWTKKSKTNSIAFQCSRSSRGMLSMLRQKLLNTGLHSLTYKICMPHLFHWSLSTAINTMKFILNVNLLRRSVKILISIHQGKTFTSMQNNHIMHRACQNGTCTYKLYHFVHKRFANW